MLRKLSQRGATRVGPRFVSLIWIENWIVEDGLGCSAYFDAG